VCGIAGKLNLDGRPISRTLMAGMADPLSHRGPDDEGHYVAGSVGLVSRRLSIIDLDTGRQPIANEDGTVWVVLNGEIYNFVELRRDLEQRGHRFRTRTDTEVIVHLYEDEGTGLLAHLRGMFAFAVWDARRRRLLLARDRLGEKPLFYAYSPGRALLFASELKSLLVDPDLRPSLDLTAIDQYLSLLYVPAPASIFKEVKKLPAGHYLTCTEAGLRVREYWDVPLPPEGEEDRLDGEALRARLTEAIRIQLRSDVPLGAFLSGGVDSTTVVAAMTDALGPAVSTCSVGFPDEGYSELPYAQHVAAAVGSHHRTRVVRPPSPEVLERLCWHFDEPFGDSSAVPTWEVSALARDRVKVALSGDGGDELFGGYDRHAVESWEHTIRRWARRASSSLARATALLPETFRGRNALARLRMAPDQACAVKFQYGASAAALKARIYSGALRERLAAADPLRGFRDAYARAQHADPLNRILYVDLKTYLADDILVKVDRMSMAHSLEVRAPFLDHRLVEMVARLPGRTKVPGPATKPLLRGVLADRVPRAAWDRPKHGFTAPIGRWLRDELRDSVEQRLFSPSSLGRDLFDRGGLRQLWDDHRSGRVEHAHELWMLLMLETWHAMRAPVQVAA
jgi:asparagine synthase (glutamine-hydrolysing)